MNEMKEHDVSRRTFVKGAGLAALAASAAGSLSLFGCAKKEEGASSGEAAPMPEEKIVWNHCAGCGGYCPLQFHVVDGTVTWVEGDTTGSDEFGGIENRACLRGRSIRRWINHPDRLKRPLKRVEGTKRGEGKYEEISWDDAINLFYEKLKYAIDTYGNEALLRVSSLGVNDNWIVPSWWDRLINMLGGQLGSYGTDSMGQADAAVGYMYFGMDCKHLSYLGSAGPVCMDADLIVLFGSSVATSNLRGGSTMYDWAMARQKGIRIINIDVRCGEEVSGDLGEWLPIRPGTDAALAAAICYVLINEGFANEEEIRKYCVGYDEETMPESVKGQHKSYKDYIQGTGYDLIAKTPEWASPITQIPVGKIYELARDIGNAKAAFIASGVGVQRRSNGENTQASIMMIPLISGHWGLPGTSVGLKPLPQSGPSASKMLDMGLNPIQKSIPITNRIDVIDRGAEMTALRDGVRGVDKLSTNVKFVYAAGTACLVNQNPDINHAGRILEDESKAEFIVGSDFFLTSSMKYCDLILPEIMPEEDDNITGITTSGNYLMTVFSEKVQDPPFECRTEYEWISALAEKFGIREQFTENRDLTDVMLEKYESLRASGNYPTLPPYEEALANGVWVQPVDRTTITPAFAAYKQDPLSNPLTTASGKIEVYSETVASLAATWELDDPRDIISPIPIFNPGFRSYEDATDEYPLMGSSFKSKIRYHSKFNQIDLLNQACRHQVWINPIDADPRGVKSGDMVRVFNDCGEIHIEARVTARVVPGAFVMEEGRMRDVDENGIDIGGCVNTLTHHHLSPLAKFNNSNSIIAQIEKL